MSFWVELLIWFVVCILCVKWVVKNPFDGNPFGRP